MGKTRIGLIGCGGIATFHISHLELMDDVQIVAVADPVQARREGMAKRVGAEKQYVNHTELLDHAREDALEAVYVCIEPTAHVACEERIVEMGLPFLVEKPMTLKLDQARALAKAIAEKGLITAVGFQDRYLDLMDIVKAELPKHRKGGLVYGSWIGGIPGVWWWQRKADCGGQLLEQNIHLVDGLRYLFGEPLSVYATCSRGIVEPGVDAAKEYDTDDHSTAVIRFPNNFTATLVSGCYVSGVSAYNGLVITLRDIILDYRLRNNLIIRTDTELRDIKRQNDQGFDEDRTFIDAVQSGDGSKIRSPYGDALKSLELAFAANESMETGKVITF